MKIIVVCLKKECYVARVEGMPGLGPSPVCKSADTAIGALVNRHRKNFDLEIEYEDHRIPEQEKKS